MGVLEYFVAILASLSAFATLFLFVRMIRGIVLSPKFIVGVLPSREEMQCKSKGITPEGNIYRRSCIEEAIFKKDCLASKVESGKFTSLKITIRSIAAKLSAYIPKVGSYFPITEYEKLDSIMKFKVNRLKQREVGVNNDRAANLPIIIQNVGRRESDRYKLIMSFSNDQVEKIHSMNLISETLKVDMFYVQEDEYIENSDLRSQNSPKVIRQKYADIGLPEDYISIVGSLASGAFEMIHLKVKVPEMVNSFRIIFRIECPTVFARRVVYAQSIRVIKSKKNNFAL